MKIGPASAVSCLLNFPYFILHYEVFQKTAAKIVKNHNREILTVPQLSSGPIDQSRTGFRPLSCFPCRDTPFPVQKSVSRAGFAETEAFPCSDTPFPAKIPVSRTCFRRLSCFSCRDTPFPVQKSVSRAGFAKTEAFPCRDTPFLAQKPVSRTGFRRLSCFPMPRHTLFRPKVCIASRFCENRGFPMQRYTISGPKTCVAKGESGAVRKNAIFTDGSH